MFDQEMMMEYLINPEHETHTVFDHQNMFHSRNDNPVFDQHVSFKK